MADKYLIGAPVQGQNKPTPLREGDNILNAHLLVGEAISLEDLFTDYRVRCSLGIEPGYVITINTELSPLGLPDTDQITLTAVGDYRVEAYQNGSLVEVYEDLSDTETLTLPESGVYDLRILPVGETPIHSMNWGQSIDAIMVRKVLSLGTDIKWEVISHRNQPLLTSFKSGFNTPSVTDMSQMFFGCFNLTSVDLSGWDTSSVTDMSSMFQGCRSLNSVNLSGLDTSSVTNMNSMFRECPSLASVDLSGLDTSSVTDMEYMFERCSSLTYVSLSGLDTSSVTNMFSMFSHCSSLASVDLSGFDTSSVTDMRGMFQGCFTLTSINLSGFNTSSVTNMGYMFQGCSSLSSLDLSGFDTSSVVNMATMFYGCSSLTTVDLSGWDTSSVVNMRNMFYGCSSLTTVDLSGWDTSSVTDMHSMFRDAKTEGVIGIDEFNISSLSTGSYYGAVDMFTGTSLPTSVYDNLLINWNAQGRSNILLGAGSSKYTPGGDAESARDNMIANGWTITDGGPA